MWQEGGRLAVVKFVENNDDEGCPSISPSRDSQDLALPESNNEILRQTLYLVGVRFFFNIYCRARERG